MTLNKQEISAVILVYNEELASNSFDSDDLSPEELVFEVEVELDPDRFIPDLVKESP